jgi:hypothetical protein
MAKRALTIPTWGCIEENIFIEKHGILKYSLSNSLDEIKIAIVTRTGNYIDLEKAVWHLNTELSINVKQLMNSHNVNFSITTFIIDKTKVLVINMRVGDSWFITGYDEIEGEFFNWELIRTHTMACQMAKNMLNNYISSVEDAEKKKPDQSNHV